MDEKQNIGRLFDRIAGTYDRFNHFLSFNIDRKWRRKAVSMLPVSGNLLDVAIGTADLSLELLRQEKAEHITGLDLSSEMMRIGESKVASKGLSSRVTFELGSALDMPYADSCFDAVTCAFGVRNFSDLDKGLVEMFRVLRPGGQVMILEFSYPSNPLVRRSYDLFFSHVMPLVGKLISKEPSAYRYFRESVKNFIWGEEMLGHIRSAGFADASFRTLSLGITTVYTAKKI